MLAKLRNRLTFANVVSVVALFVALSGTSIAAVTLKRNAVKGKHIAKNAVTAPKVKNASLLSEDFAPGQLPKGEKGDPGPPGSDADFNGAPAGGDLAGSYPNPSLRESEAWHEIEPANTPGGEPDFQNNWSNLGTTTTSAAFYIDRGGRVHLKGVVKSSTGSAGTIFTLPAGYRPSQTPIFGAASDTPQPSATGAFGQIYVNGLNQGSRAGEVEAFRHGGPGGWISLDGISFRAGG